MAIFLVQHGKSASKDIDPKKGLTDQGRKETERIAQVAKGYDIKVKKIVHSGKRRAEQTAAIYQTTFQLQAPPTAVVGIDPLDDVRVFAESLDPAADMMVVGHMPFMQRLVSYLTVGSDAVRVYQFQNSGIVCLDAEKGEDGKPDWFIRWTLNPNIA
jgi:phosphohistidine phosphatase